MHRKDGNLESHGTTINPTSTTQSNPGAETKQPKQYVITSVKVHGESLYDHSGINFGPISKASDKSYYTVHPRQGQLPRHLDPDDGSTQMLILFNNLKTATYTGKDFRSSDELKYSHEYVEIPVTKEEYKRAKAFAKAEKQAAENGSTKYGIIPTTKTGSCAKFHNDVLHKIAKPEEKDGISPIGSFWPTTSFENAKHIATQRTPDGQRKHSTPPKPTSQTDTSVTNLGFFGQLTQSFLDSQREKQERHSPWVKRNK